MCGVGKKSVVLCVSGVSSDVRQSANQTILNSLKPTEPVCEESIVLHYKNSSASLLGLFRLERRVFDCSFIVESYTESEHACVSNQLLPSLSPFLDRETVFYSEQFKCLTEFADDTNTDFEFRQCN